MFKPETSEALDIGIFSLYNRDSLKCARHISLIQLNNLCLSKAISYLLAFVHGHKGMLLLLFLGHRRNFSVYQQKTLEAEVEAGGRSSCFLSFNKKHNLVGAERTSPCFPRYPFYLQNRNNKQNISKWFTTVYQSDIVRYTVVYFYKGDFIYETNQFV